MHTHRETCISTWTTIARFGGALALYLASGPLTLVLTGLWWPPLALLASAQSNFCFSPLIPLLCKLQRWFWLACELRHPTKPVYHGKPETCIWKFKTWVRHKFTEDEAQRATSANLECQSWNAEPISNTRAPNISFATRSDYNPTSSFSARTFPRQSKCWSLPRSGRRICHNCGSEAGVFSFSLCSLWGRVHNNQGAITSQKSSARCKQGASRVSFL